MTGGGEYVMCLEVRGCLMGVSSLLQPCGSQGSKFRSLGLVVSTLLDEPSYSLTNPAFACQTEVWPSYW